MAIGCKTARNLMRRLGWKAKVIATATGLKIVELYCSLRPNRYKVRIGSFAKLLRECRGIEQISANTAILSYVGRGPE